jgi:hypothetical protein
MNCTGLVSVCAALVQPAVWSTSWHLRAIEFAQKTKRELLQTLLALVTKGKLAVHSPIAELPIIAAWRKEVNAEVLEIGLTRIKQQQRKPASKPKSTPDHPAQRKDR